MTIIRDYNGNHSNGLTRYLINTKGDKATEFFEVSYSSISSGRHELAPFGIYGNNAKSFHSKCNENDWLRIDFKSPVSVSSYSLKSYTSSYFISWKLQGMEVDKPGFYWYNIDERNNDTSLSGGKLANFIPKNLSSTKTKRIKLVMQGKRAINNDYCLEIFHFEVFGKMYKDNEFIKCSKRKGDCYSFMNYALYLILILE